jgi:hypothetical protein
MTRLAHAYLFLALLASPTYAHLVVTSVSDNPLDCDYPSIAQLPSRLTLVAWEDAHHQIWVAYAPLPTEPPAAATDDPEATSPGSGFSPRVVSTWRGPLLVWANGTKIYFQFDPAGTPDPPVEVETGHDLANLDLDVWGVEDPGWDVAWVVLAVPTPGNHQDVSMLRITKGQPEGPVVVAVGVPYWQVPQVTETPGWPQPRPRIYYFLEDTFLAYRTEVDYDVWSPESVVPYEGFGTEFDASTNATGAQAILSLGPTPTCPCNNIQAIHQDDEGEWQPPHQLTVDYDFLNWPQSPCVALDTQGRTHAFWMQITSDFEMQQTRRTLEYWVKDGDDWTDAGQELDSYSVGGIGRRVAMDLTAADEAVFAWSVKDTVAGVPQPRRIMVARPSSLVAVDDGAPPLPRATLAAWPNPFNPVVNLAGTAPPGTESALAIHDLTGRHLRTLAIAPAADGHFSTRWDGRDEAGRALASGIYVVRLGEGAQAICQRVVLAR